MGCVSTKVHPNGIREKVSNEQKNMRYSNDDTIPEFFKNNENLQLVSPKSELNEKSRADSANKEDNVEGKRKQNIIRISLGEYIIR